MPDVLFDIGSINTFLQVKCSGLNQFALTKPERRLFPEPGLISNMAAASPPARAVHRLRS